MTKTVIVAMFAIVVLVAGSISGPIAYLQPAEAIKSKGTGLPEIGSKKVCGDRLCSETPKMPKPKQWNRQSNKLQ